MKLILVICYLLILMLQSNAQTRRTALSPADQEWLRIEASKRGIAPAEAAAKYDDLLTADGRTALNAAAFFESKRAYDILAKALARIVEHPGHHYAVTVLLQQSAYNALVVDALIGELDRLNADTAEDMNEPVSAADKRNLAKAIAKHLGMSEPTADFESTTAVSALNAEFKKAASRKKAAQSQ